MEFHKVDFIKSVAVDGDYPDGIYPEFVLAGRSNVGKSSFINCLCNRKNMAFVGKTPGKTQLLNFFEVDEKMMIVDVPGYGYATRSFDKLIHFGKMMEDYFKNRETLRALLLIVDLRHKPTKDDVSMIEFAKENHIHTFIIATKHDKCKNSEVVKLTKQVSQTLGVSVSNIILFSSVTRKGHEEIWNKLNEMVNETAK
ncbi:MAG: ribosome biogenesis GTP-binding protein YihA/YsxC [Erysipelotrichaceae bacterium]